MQVKGIKGKFKSNLWKCRKTRKKERTNEEERKKTNEDNVHRARKNKGRTVNSTE